VWRGRTIHGGGWKSRFESAVSTLVPLGRYEAAAAACAASRPWPCSRRWPWPEPAVIGDSVERNDVLRARLVGAGAGGVQYTAAYSTLTHFRTLTLTLTLTLTNPTYGLNCNTGAPSAQPAKPPRRTPHAAQTLCVCLSLRHITLANRSVRTRRATTFRPPPLTTESPTTLYCPTPNPSA
jgi:hypothetical protein